MCIRLYLGMRFVLCCDILQELMILRAIITDIKQYKSYRWFSGCWCLTEGSVQAYFEM